MLRRLAWKHYVKKYCDEMTGRVRSDCGCKEETIWDLSTVDYNTCCAHERESSIHFSLNKVSVDAIL